MRITAELSLYPLSDTHISSIKDFITRLKSYKELEIVTNATSTQVVGEHNDLFEILRKETATTFSEGKAVFVMKILGFERDIRKPY